MQAKQFDPAAFDNQLIRQKNRIIEMIDNGDITKAKAALAVVQEMWEANNYGYKITELQNRIHNYNRGHETL